jgi:hypothetical protein
MCGAVYRDSECDAFINLFDEIQLVWCVYQLSAVSLQFDDGHNNVFGEVSVLLFVGEI